MWNSIYIPQYKYLALNLKSKRVEYPSTLAAIYDYAVEDRQDVSNDIKKHHPDSPTKFNLDFEVKKVCKYCLKYPYTFNYSLMFA